MNIAGKHAEIARRYAWQARQYRADTAPLTIGTMRTAELERIYRDRFGGRFPSSSEGLHALTVMASHHLDKNTTDAVAGWLGKVAPWVRGYGDAAMDIVKKAQTLPRRWTASDLGERIGLTLEERKRLRIKTIRAVGQTDAGMAETRKEAARERKANDRRALGVKPRAEYEANSKSRIKPWEAMKMSRSTWYAKGQPKPSDVRTGPSAVKVEKISIADTPVRRVDLIWPSAFRALTRAPSKEIFDKGIDRTNLVYREAS